MSDDRSRRGRTARQRGNSYERSVARRLGLSRTGQYGTKVDVGAVDDWIVAQCKTGSSYPERLDKWLRDLPVNDRQQRAVVISDSPGPGHRRRELIVFDFSEWLLWYGPVSEDE